jgi:hypothetical protein
MLRLFAHLNLCLLSQGDHDVQNKYSIQKTEAKKVGGKWKWITCIFSVNVVSTTQQASLLQRKGKFPGKILVA